MAAMLYRQNLVIPLLPVIGTFLREGRKEGRKESRRGEHMAREEEEPCSLVEFRLNVKRSRKIKGTERQREEQRGRNRERKLHERGGTGADNGARE